MAHETLITLTGDIVAAHVSNNNVSIGDVPDLIRTVFVALSAAENPPPATEEKREPAVSIRSSVKHDAITCLECGAKMKMLKRHLANDHGMSPAEYRTRWGLNSDYPMVAPEYAGRRRELAIGFGLGRKPAAPAAAPTAAPAEIEAEPAKPARRRPRAEKQAE